MPDPFLVLALHPTLLHQTIEVCNAFPHGKHELLHIQFAIKHHRENVMGATGLRATLFPHHLQLPLVMGNQIIDTRRHAAKRQTVGGQHQGVVWQGIRSAVRLSTKAVTGFASGADGRTIRLLEMVGST